MLGIYSTAHLFMQAGRYMKVAEHIHWLYIGHPWASQSWGLLLSCFALFGMSQLRHLLGQSI